MNLHPVPDIHPTHQSNQICNEFWCKHITDIAFVPLGVILNFFSRFPNLLQFKSSSSYLLSKFLRRSLMIFIIKGFRTIVFIFIVISTTFRPISPPAFFRCLSNSGTFMVLRTTSFIESTGVSCSDSVCHNRIQVLSLPVFTRLLSGLNLQPPDDCVLRILRNRYNRYAMRPAEGSRVRQTPEEGRRTYRPKRGRNNNKDEDNNPKTFNDKN